MFNKCCLLCCFKSNPLDIIVRVQFGGYTPGQTINVQIEANNKSDEQVSHFIVQLIKVSMVPKIDLINFIDFNCFFVVQHVSYHTHTSAYAKKLEAVVVCEGKTQGCDLNSNVNLCASFVVPAISSTDKTTSKIIKFDYSIRVR